MVIVALIAMMSVACKNKTTAVSSFTFETESEEPTSPSETPTIPDGIDKSTLTTFSGNYQSGKQTYKSGNYEIAVYYAATVDGSANTVTIKKYSDSTFKDASETHVFNASGNGAKYTVKSEKPYNIVLNGEIVYTYGGTATFDASGYLTIVFDWGGKTQTVKFSKQA